ncbi:MAG: trimethylamine methyltransferase family protein [Rhodospirillaceae bacterium]|nr:trimethylamine methyltransferase family protein [Rhodospirillaceae bacterium]
MVDRERRGRRDRTGGRRKGRKPDGETPRATSSPADRGVDYRHLKNPLPLAKAFSDDQTEQIHRTALRVIEELGIRVLHDGARDRFRKAGATVDETSQMVRIDSVLVERALATAPSEFSLAGGNPGRTVQIGGTNLTFTPVGGPPHAIDSDRGKRPGTHEDFRDFVKLAQSFDVMHMLNPSVEPQDVANHSRHLEVTRDMLFLSDKPFFIYSRGEPQVRDCLELVRIARGLDETAFKAQPHCFTVINTNSPRQLDIPMCQGIMDFAAAGQPSMITPFTLAGAMAPITMVGALTLQHAEALAGVTLSQIVNPGAPVIYGSFTSNVDMKSGAPAFGTPEFVKAAFGAGQLARHVGLPWRGSAATASNAPDVQACYETLNSAWASMLGGVNVLIHAAGWLEGGLSASYEKFILDVEALQILAEACHSLPATEADSAFEAIAEVEPGGHFFGNTHTMERYQTAFYDPLVSDWSNFGQWTDNGSKTATERANGIWKRVLKEYEPPKLEDDARQAIDEFVERRISEGGAEPES